ncbi:AMP-dependent synthetase and ligase [Geobacter metallireducens RCH3]|uniref:Acyl-CoA synthetase, AMP-forming n=1 Tax=Geobacter metallireducens (strain ATCC 53774 / DSM 7210 / GS-15) TaxID=269799 RepID=Q39S64_GEOMG|nr:AMP-binding protein [Geobacter metallireducens]ABB32910.1 acyl-CoA synthetase, AMP-forming [Geobacter metallireducens GS-15]EHP88956.1 AMP-dependent synthetase and ligase [Geobacter metallireducens RCH3]
MAQHLDFTIGGLLDHMAVTFPDNDALVYPERGLRYSYRQFNDICRQVAKGLLKLGVRKGDHVAIWAYNVPEWVILQFATAKIGVVLVTVNTAYKSAELEYLLDQSDSTTLFMVRSWKDTDYVATLSEVVPELASAEAGLLTTPKLPFLKRVVFIGEDTPAGMLNFEKIAEMGKEVPDEQLAAVESSLDVHDVINMQYTSGTTGFPKGVMLTHYNLVNNGYHIGECMKFTDKDRLCIPVPFFHCFGSVLAVMASVTHATAMVPVEIFDPLKVLQTVEKERCTAVHGVPTMFIAELEHPDFAKFDLSTLRTGIMAGSVCPIEVMKRCVKDMNLTELTSVYGQTESSPGITQTRTEDSVELRVSTVGRALPGAEVKTVDIETGATLPPGKQGELCARGYMVMKGYYKMPEETAKVIDADGWLHTGDLAVMDENGYCKITGRIKQMIIRGGENIYPKEIEEFLYTHPKISDVQIYGVPDRKYGEQVMAAIILKNGVEMTEDEVKEFCRGKIANYKIPKYVKFVAGYPMTASGKIQKFKLREMAIKELGLEGAGDAA